MMNACLWKCLLLLLPFLSLPLLVHVTNVDLRAGGVYARRVDSKALAASVPTTFVTPASTLPIGPKRLFASLL